MGWCWLPVASPTLLDLLLYPAIPLSTPGFPFIMGCCCCGWSRVDGANAETAQHDFANTALSQPPGISHERRVEFLERAEGVLEVL